MGLSKEELATREKKIASRDAKLRKALPKAIECVNSIDDAVAALDKALRGKEPVDPKLVAKLQASLGKMDSKLVSAHNAISEALN